MPNADDEVLNSFLQTPFLATSEHISDHYSPEEKVEHIVEIIDGKEVHKFYPASLDDIIAFLAKYFKENKTIYVSFLGHILCSDKIKLSIGDISNLSDYYNEVYGINRPDMFNKAYMKSFQRQDYEEVYNRRFGLILSANRAYASFISSLEYISSYEKDQEVSYGNYDKNRFYKIDKDNLDLDEIAKQIYGLYNTNFNEEFKDIKASKMSIK